MEEVSLGNGCLVRIKFFYVYISGNFNLAGISPFEGSNPYMPIDKNHLRYLKWIVENTAPINTERAGIKFPCVIPRKKEILCDSRDIKITAL